MSDLISVVIPVYNVEQYLRRCVDSVLKQTYKKLEIILINDGSTDTSGDICDEYSLFDPRIKVIHKNNGGLSDARNTGIEVASGLHITFIDSDDWVSANYIEVLYNLLIIKDSDISMCNFQKLPAQNISKNRDNIEIYEFTNIEALNELVGKYYIQMVVTWGKLYKYGLFKEIRFPFGKIHEDEFTTYKLLYKANKVVFTTEPLVYYWQRSDSITGSGFNLKNALHKIEALRNRAIFFDSIEQYQLQDKTKKTLFGVYKSINKNIHMFKSEYYKDKYIREFQKFKKELRGSSQSITFKFYYEIYFKFPKLAYIIEIIYKRLFSQNNAKYK